MCIENTLMYFIFVDSALFVLPRAYILGSTMLVVLVSQSVSVLNFKSD